MRAKNRYTFVRRKIEKNKTFVDKEHNRNIEKRMDVN